MHQLLYASQMRYKTNFKQSISGLNSEFSFSKIG